MYDYARKAQSEYLTHHIRFHTAANGGGSVLSADITIKGLHNLTVYAAHYDGSGTYIGDVTVTWTGSGIINGNLSTASGTSTSFLALSTEGSGTITAVHPEYGSFTTPNITVNNSLYLKESMRCWNYAATGCTKASNDWQVNGGQSVLGGTYALIIYSWPDINGLPDAATGAVLHIYKDSAAGTGTYHYSVFPMTASWRDEDYTSWAVRPPHNQSDEKAFTNWPPGGAVGWYTIDITAYYNDWFVMTDFYGFAFYTTTFWNASTFHTVCGPGYAEAAKRPYLSVTRGGNTVDFRIVELP